MEPLHQRIRVNNVELSYFEWGSDSQFTVLLCHATGFHGRCWDRVVSYLPTHVRVIALEHRGHGRSAKTGPYDWQTFGEDLVVFVKELDLSDLIAVGHSMGGMTVLYAATKESSRFNDLLLLDPVIMEPGFYQSQTTVQQYADVSEHPISRRIDEWASPSAMFKKFASRHPFNLWQPEVLMDYCKYGLEENPQRRDADSAFHLACPPQVEASIYMHNNVFDPHTILNDVRQPVTIYRAEQRPKDQTQMDFSKSPTWPLLATKLQNATDVHLPFLSHFIPMQDPFLVATQINSLIGQT